MFNLSLRRSETTVARGLAKTILSFFVVDSVVDALFFFCGSLRFAGVLMKSYEYGVVADFFYTTKIYNEFVRLKKGVFLAGNDYRLNLAFGISKSHIDYFAEISAVEYVYYVFLLDFGITRFHNILPAVGL